MKTRHLLGLLTALTLAAAPALANDKAACFGAADKGQTLRDAHKLVLAREEFRRCAASTCPSAVQADCTAWLSDTDKTIPTVVLSAKDASGNDTTDVSVRLDDVPLAPKLDGIAVPVDPGPHTFHFQASDGTSKERHVVVLEGQKAVDVGVSFALPAQRPSPSPKAPSERSSNVRMVGYVVGGVGLAGLVVAGVLGGATFAKVNRAKSECGASGCGDTTSQTAVSDMQSARALGDASTVLFVAGGALLAGGLVMVLTGGTKTSASALRLAPLVTAHGASAGIVGVW